MSRAKCTNFYILWLQIWNTLNRLFYAIIAIRLLYVGKLLDHRQILMIIIAVAISSKFDDSIAMCYCITIGTGTIVLCNCLSITTTTTSSSASSSFSSTIGGNKGALLLNCRITRLLLLYRFELLYMSILWSFGDNCKSPFLIISALYIGR